MAAIFDLPVTPMSQSVQTSYAVLAVRENVGIAFGVVFTISCLEADIIIIIILIKHLFSAQNP